MKITTVRTELVQLPADEPLAGAAENSGGFAAHCHARARYG